MHEYQPTGATSVINASETSAGCTAEQGRRRAVLRHVEHVLYYSSERRIEFAEQVMLPEGRLR